MSYTIERLRSLSDDELISEHDSMARSTVVGVEYFLEELDRRSRERSTVAANRLARNSFWLSVISTAIAIAALVVAIAKV
ncbi:hypothetical protein [Agromyces sp. M3QZ16-3]|uniref:hypothetical protein n=1 Tax=Agromyces sp. M3QZ16-3 TaxID=3447585 RepID=UPI003F68D978